jgi:arylsulfatase A-like enzyme
MKKTMLSVVLAVTFITVAYTTCPAATPNLVVILADDLGFGDLACYGSTDMRTPNLDRLAQEGMRLNRFYANCCVCSPTRAALLTGRYPELVGVPGVIRTKANDNWGHLAANAVLLPKKLKPAGYTSAIIGKWHLGLESPNTPNERGFDFFQGFLGDMMDDYYNHLRHGNNYMRRNGEEIKPEGHATELFTQWACDYFAQRKGQPEPFFLYLAYNAPHSPIQPPEEWLKKVTQRETGISEKRAKLVALIEHLDDGVGRVLAALKANGLAENTLVIFTSDNGGDLGPGANNGSHRNGKGSMYEGGLRVPFMARWPGHIKPGTQSLKAALSMDIFATALELAGLPADQNVEATSFLPVLLGKENPAAEREVFFTRREGGNPFGGKTIDAVIRGNWKLLQNTPYTPLELYDLGTDPQEKEDVAGKQKKIFNELSASLRAQIQRGGAVPWQKR